jgi:hypothetical protein
MLIFGVNFPLPEIFLILVVLFFFFLIIILLEIQKLQKMTVEERKELEELGRISHEQNKDINEMMDFERKQSADLAKFERAIMELEEDTDTIYLKRLAPDLYKIQNYTLWGISKGMSPMQIKQNLMSRGWRNSKLVDMIIEDTIKYTGHIKIGDLGGDAAEPPANVIIREIQTSKDGQTTVVEKRSDGQAVKVQETTRIIKPVKVIRLKETVIRSRAKKKSKKKSSGKRKSKARAPKKPTADLTSIEKELNKLEKNLKQDRPKKISAKTKSTKKAASKKKAGKKKAGNLKSDKNSATVHLEAKKGTEVKVTYK